MNNDKQKSIRQASPANRSYNPKNVYSGEAGDKQVHAVVSSRKNSAGEYRVALFIDGVNQGEGPAYYTSDIDDARKTAQAMVTKALRTASQAFFDQENFSDNPSFKARGRSGRLVAKKATDEYADARGKHVKLYNTEIVSLNPDGSVTLRTGGYMTVTTKRRINQVAQQWGLGFTLGTVKGKWAVTLATGINLRFKDGMTFNPNGIFGENQSYQPKTGAQCSCKPGQQRNNCPRCEGTGMVVDFAKIRGGFKSNPIGDIKLQEKRGVQWFTIASFAADKKATAIKVGKQHHRRHPHKHLRVLVK